MQIFKMLLGIWRIWHHASFSGTCWYRGHHSPVILTCNVFIVIYGMFSVFNVPRNMYSMMLSRCMPINMLKYTIEPIEIRQEYMYTVFLMSISVRYRLEDPPTYCVFLACFGNPKGTMSKKRQNVKDVLYNWQQDGKRCCTTRDLLPLV